MFLIIDNRCFELMMSDGWHLSFVFDTENETFQEVAISLETCGMYSIYLLLRPTGTVVCLKT